MKDIAINIGSEFGSPLGQSKTLGNVVSLILNTSFAISGIIILFLFIFAGYSFIAGAGSNDPQSIEKGKKAATSAIIGFIIILSAYWIVRVVEIITGSSFVTNPGI